VCLSKSNLSTERKAHHDAIKISAKTFKSAEIGFLDFYEFIKIEIAPFPHSLSFLAKQSSLYEKLSEEQMDFIDLLEPMNIETRYPTHKEQLLKSLTNKRCVDILEKTQELYQWIIQKL